MSLEYAFQGREQYWYGNGYDLQSRGKQWMVSSIANYSLAVDKAIALLNDGTIDLAGIEFFLDICHIDYYILNQTVHIV